MYKYLDGWNSRLNDRFLGHIEEKQKITKRVLFKIFADLFDSSNTECKWKQQFMTKQKN